MKVNRALVRRSGSGVHQSSCHLAIYSPSFQSIFSPALTRFMLLFEDSTLVKLVTLFQEEQVAFHLLSRRSNASTDHLPIWRTDDGPSFLPLSLPLLLFLDSSLSYQFFTKLRSRLTILSLQIWQRQEYLNPPNTDLLASNFPRLISTKDLHCSSLTSRIWS